MQDYEPVYAMVMERQEGLRRKAAARRLVSGSWRIEVRLPRLAVFSRGSATRNQPSESATREAA